MSDYDDDFWGEPLWDELEGCNDDWESASDDAEDEDNYYDDLYDEVW